MNDIDEPQAAATSISPSESLPLASIADLDAMRAELSRYVEDVEMKKDSEGNPLIYIPDNFETIVESMNREDLEDKNETPWSQYLIMESLTTQLGDAEYGGRYRNALADEDDVKIQKGLARIKLLDRQLQDVTKRETLSTPMVPPQSKVSEETAVNDGTFVTRLRSADEHGHSEHTSPRSPNAISVSKKNKTTHTLAKQNDFFSVDDEKRLEVLISGDIDNDPEFCDHAYKELAEETKCIDDKLQHFGRLHRLSSPMSAGGEVVAEDSGIIESSESAPRVPPRGRKQNRDDDHLQKQVPRRRRS